MIIFFSIIITIIVIVVFNNSKNSSSSCCSSSCCSSDSNDVIVSSIKLSIIIPTLWSIQHFIFHHNLSNLFLFMSPGPSIQNMPNLNKLNDMTGGKIPEIPPGMKIEDLKDAFYNMPSEMKERLNEMAQCKFPVSILESIYKITNWLSFGTSRSSFRRMAKKAE